MREKIRIAMSEVPTRIWVSLGILALLCIPIGAQLQQSGGVVSVTITSGTVTANQGGSPWSQNVTQFGSSNVVTGTGASGAGVPRFTVSNDSTLGLVAGTSVVGYVRQMPPGCSTLTSDVVHDVVGVATGAGTSVSSVTGCIESIFVNNITNSAVTFRLADKSGTPVIWIGGNSDFTIPANSNLALTPQLSGITGTSGWTAIAGTSSALNLHVVTRE